MSAKAHRSGKKPPFALILVALFFVLAILGPIIAPYDPEAIDLRRQFEPPSLEHWLGTADNGVDILSVVLHGARLAGIVSITVVLGSFVFGAFVGIVAGYYGKWSDHAISGVADVIQAFPAIILNIAILALVSEPGLLHLIAALLINGWVLYARVARAQTFTVREFEYVQAARALGASDARVLFRHVLPNVFGPLLVQATSGFGAAILAESTLSFLGLGPGTSTSWGALLDQGSTVLLRFPHVALAPGAAIAITVLGFNLSGTWLGDRLNPRTI